MEERKKRVGRPSSNKTKSTTGTRTKKRNTKQSKPGLTSRMEIIGLICVAFSLYSLYSFFWGTEGTIGDYAGMLFSYLFGYGGWIAILALLWFGCCMLYKDFRIHVTLKGIEATVLYLSILGFISVFTTSVDTATQSTTWRQSGGLVGGLLYGGIGSLLGNFGAVLVLIVMFIVSLLLLCRISMRPLLHKSVETTQRGAMVAKEHISEATGNFKDEIKVKLEERRLRKAEKEAFDQERHERFAGDDDVIEEVVPQPEPEQEKYGSVFSHRVAAVVTPPVVEEAKVTPSFRPLDEAAPVASSNPGEPSMMDQIAMPPVEPIDKSPVESIERVQEVPSVIEEGEVSPVFDREEVNPVYHEWDEPSVPVEQHIEPALHEEVGQAEVGHAEGSEWEAQPEEEAEVPGFMDAVASAPVAPIASAPVTPVASAAVAPLASDIGAMAAATSVAPVASTLVDPVEDRIITKEDTTADRAEVAVEIDEKGARPHPLLSSYQYPPLDMLAKGPILEVDEREVHEKSGLLESTLSNFNIHAKVIHATRGPTVTRYELELAPGTKVSKVTGLVDELKLALAARDIRMEAPIPGKSAVGIELPNDTVSPVYLRDVLDCDDFIKAKVGIPVGLGKDIAGNPVVTDLAKTPHLLVAGSTGSGKSVCINTLISSILFGRSPEEVKLILVDPKMVELSNYNGIPHLVVPVVTDMRKAAAVLRWAVREMDARYLAMAGGGVRDIKSFNEQYPDKKMPFIVIIIDELADLMMTSPDDVEESICRIAQKARAAGIHMVLATQRPTVNIITGTIKANVPSRISFAVAQANDSRTILDQMGAQKLLGKGDMLFSPVGANKPIRVQGAFISDSEVESLVDFVKEHGTARYDEEVMQAVEEPEEEAVDFAHQQGPQDDLRPALEIILQTNQASASMFQRKMRIGFAKAGRLIDQLEELKVIGPNLGSKPREVLMTEAEIRERFFSDPVS